MTDSIGQQLTHSQLCPVQVRLGNRMAREEPPELYAQLTRGRRLRRIKEKLH